MAQQQGSKSKIEGHRILDRMYRRLGMAAFDFHA
jgi:hypothetical protein